MDKASHAFFPLATMEKVTEHAFMTITISPGVRHLVMLRIGEIA